MLQLKKGDAMVSWNGRLIIVMYTIISFLASLQLYSNGYCVFHIRGASIWKIKSN